MNNTEFEHLDTKIRNLENQLKPILSTPRNPQTTPSDLIAVDEFHDCLHIMSDRLSAEMGKASSDETRPLKDIVKRVVLLQKAAHSWTEGSSSLGSFEESCVTDDGAGLSGFKVYENPVFDGVLNEDDDGDDSTVDGYEVEEFERKEEAESVMIRVADHNEVQESEAVNESVEKEVLEIDCQNEDVNVNKKEEDENEEKEDEEEEENDDDYEDENQEEGASKCCYKTMFWGLITVMVTMSISMGFLNFSNHQSSVILLAPT